MNTHYPNMFQPIRVGTLTLRNRLALAPMSYSYNAPEGGFCEEWIRFCERVAKGGTALITVGEVNPGVVTAENLCYRTHPDVIMTGERKNYQRLRFMAEAIHQHGAIASVEVAHAGALADPELNCGKMPVGPSRLSPDPRIKRGKPELAVPMTVEMMEQVAEDYADAVEVLKKAGFDMVMIHAAHGTLLYEFLSTIFNKRTDEYGGCVKNRVRFLRMVLTKIKDRVGWNFPLDIRLSGSEVLEGGYSLDELCQICKEIEDCVDMISISCGGVYSDEGRERMFVLGFMERGANVPFAEAVKKAGVRVPISCVGGIADPKQIEQILQNGRADIVYMGHQHIADPDFAKKARRGAAEEINRCIRCHTCQFTSAIAEDHSRRCSVNPMVGFYGKLPDPLPRAEVRKRVLVVGGGIAGMEAARTAAGRGHEVILCEKSARLGGLLWFSEHVRFKSDFKVLIERMALCCEADKNIEIRLNTKVTSEFIRELRPDAVISAVGSVHVIPNIPGVEQPHVILGKDAFSAAEQLEGPVVILGGGLTGCELAVHLGENRIQTTVIEMTDRLAAGANPTYAYSLFKALDRCADKMLATKCTEIKKDTVICEHMGESFELEAKTVVLALGMRARTETAWEFAAQADESAVIGDCKAPRKIIDAMREGFFAAADL